jgi:hypothetical protein
MMNGIVSRRDLLRRTGHGFGMAALAGIMTSDGLLATDGSIDLRPKPTHFPAQAKSVIQLFQAGGPSQMDLFDPKPELQKRDATHYILPGLKDADASSTLMGSPYKFQKYGESGMEFSELLPHTATVADDLCMVRSMFSEHQAHPEGMIMLMTNKIFRGRPVMGAWITYGLGTENQNLPAYVVIRDPKGYNANGPLTWENGFLPALFGGTEFNSEGAPVFNLKPATAVSEETQRKKLDLLAKLNEEYRRLHPQERDFETRIRNYEIAARMQLAATGVMDVSKESEATRKLYGLDEPETAGYGRRCLQARRLIEAGVRFVQVFPPIEPFVSPWDNHTNIRTELPIIAKNTDKPFMALVKDLKARGLLETTMVQWVGEFGRMPISQNGQGRDHNKYAFTMLLAGGGFKGGYVHGATDELAYKAVDKRVSVPDFHATVLHQLGLDHRKLAYTFNGRAETDTDYQITGAYVVKELLKRPPLVS